MLKEMCDIKRKCESYVLFNILMNYYETFYIIIGPPSCFPLSKARIQLLFIVISCSFYHCRDTLSQIWDK